MRRPAFGSAWNARIHAALAKFDMFNSQAQWESFVRATPGLNSYLNSLPWGEHDTRRQRVNLITASLIERKHNDLGWMFVVLVKALLGHYQESIIIDHMEACSTIRELLPAIEADAAEWGWG